MLPKFGTEEAGENCIWLILKSSMLRKIARNVRKTVKAQATTEIASLLATPCNTPLYIQLRKSHCGTRQSNAKIIKLENVLL
jgi:hypothetical protein